MYQALIRHRDHSGTKLAEFVGRGRRGSTPGGLSYFNYLKRVRTAGGWEMGINAGDDRALAFEPFHLVEFWLKDQRGGAAYDAWIASLPSYRRSALLPGWWRDWTGLVLTEPRIEQSADGSYTSVLRGRGLNEFPKLEYILYGEGTTEAEKSGAAETVAKAFVDENIGPSAGVDALGLSRVRTGLTVETDSGTGATWSGDRSGKVLIEVLAEIAAFTGADFNIVQTGDATFEFQWREDQWGDDKTLGNADGNAPVIFSARRRNVESVVSEKSLLDTANVVITQGQGYGDNQAEGGAYLAGELTDTSWARRAVLRKASDQYGAANLNTIAEAVLDQQRARVEINVDVKMVTNTRYGRDWWLGDLVTAEDTRAGRQVNQKVVGVRVAASASEQRVTIKPELQDYD